MKVCDLVAQFRADAELRVKTKQIGPKTLQFYHFQLIKLASVGHLPAAMLRLEHLHAVDFSPHFLRVLKQVFRFARLSKFVADDPFEQVKIPSTGQRQRTLTRRELARLYLSATKRFRLLIYLAAHTAARPHELRNLKWFQLDLDRRVIVLTKFKGKERRRDGKQLRFIPLDARSTARLRRIKARLRPADSDPVIPTKSGRHWGYNTQRVAMRNARDKAGLGADFTGEKIVCYSLRHTAATEAVRRGVRADELADVMGHTNVGMTRRYLHRTAEDLVKIMDRKG